MISADELLKNLEDVRSACVDVLRDLKRHIEERPYKEISVSNYGYEKYVLLKEIEFAEENLRKEIGELRKNLNPEHLQELLIKRLSEVTAREKLVSEREDNVFYDEIRVKIDKSRINKIYDDCIEIATKEVTKVKNEMVAVYCEKLEEVEELLEVVRATDMPQFQLELFEQLREVSPFVYKAESVAGFVETPKSESENDSNTTRTKEVTELDNRSSELDKRENELALEAARLEELRQQLLSASTKKRTTTRSKYKLEEVPAYKARANELKAERSLPWKEWTKTDAGREYLRLSSAVRRLEKV